MTDPCNEPDHFRELGQLLSRLNDEGRDGTHLSRGPPGPVTDLIILQLGLVIESLLEQRLDRTSVTPSICPIDLPDTNLPDNYYTELLDSLSICPDPPANRLPETDEDERPSLILPPSLAHLPETDDDECPSLILPPSLACDTGSPIMEVE